MQAQMQGDDDHGGACSPGALAVDAERAGGPVLEAMRARLSEATRAYSDASRLTALLGEAAPFVEAAARAQTVASADATSMSWREARSLAWLLGYRLGDQSMPAAIASAVGPAWRDASGAPTAQGDEISALVLDGYARGREDRMKADALATLAQATPVVELGKGVVAVFAAGPLDADGARAVADRAAARALRSDAVAVLLDVSRLTNPTAASLAELWVLASSTQMLGARFLVTGVRDELAALLEAAGLGMPRQHEVRVATVSDALEHAAREAQGSPLPANDASTEGDAPVSADVEPVSRLLAWVRRVFGRAR